eukprot:TRINITY_DN8834_c0_g1_i1.p1 TRINITY_DN8834_c0_g1~~TRINITY_DN8834_c0_g1_i1.p1  ORF type:complete len:355 (+),score=66.91 TRINITY_DN8834_c0_g1_i1:1-1065(+)
MSSNSTTSNCVTTTTSSTKNLTTICETSLNENSDGSQMTFDLPNQAKATFDLPTQPKAAFDLPKHTQQTTPDLSTQATMAFDFQNHAKTTFDLPTQTKATFDLQTPPQRARLVRVDSQMSDYSDVISLDKNSTFSGSSFDVNQNRCNEKSEKGSSEEFEKIKAEKNLLVDRIKSKLEIIREERDLVKQELQENENTIEKLITDLSGIARIRDIDRIRRHSEEVGALASLIQCLSNRLEKLEGEKSPTKMTDITNKSNNLDEKIERFQPSIILNNDSTGKVEKLRCQLEDAKQLRALSNMRRDNLTKLISDNLDENSGHDFNFCMKEKTRLTLELREFEEKIKAGEEHLNNLMQI